MGAVSGGGDRSLVEGSGLRWREAVLGGGERSLVEGSGLRWRGAIAGGGEQSQLATTSPVEQAAKSLDFFYL